MYALLVRRGEVIYYSGVGCSGPLRYYYSIALMYCSHYLYYVLVGLMVLVVLYCW